MTDLVQLSLTEAAAVLRRGNVSSAELVAATLQQIEATEPAIHAYARVFANTAPTIAAERDKELARGIDRGPLHGIPVAIKDLLYTADAPTESGSEALAGFQPTFDASIVTRLRQAGAVIVGKTVTHELAYGVNTPPTRNPWGSDHYPGGSSAGSGAAVAARSAFGAIGTDTGGSIREPASLNGLVGLKPTYGLVSRYGVAPLSPSLDHAGPMTRTVEDNAALLSAIAGYDERDPASVDAGSSPPVPVSEAGVRGMRIGTDRARMFPAGVQPDVARAVQAVLDELSRAGAEIVEVSIPELELVSAIGMTILLAEASAEYGRLLRARGDRLHPQTRIMLELGEFVPGTQYTLALRARVLFQRAFQRAYREQRLDALIGPTLPSPTVAMNVLGMPDENGEDPMTAAIDATFPANISGLPALTFPCGFSADGFPIGAQLLGRPLGESDLYRIALAYQRDHDWHTRLPPAFSGSPRDR